MKKFKQWLSESPWVNPDIDKEKLVDKPYNQPLANHISTMPSGHLIMREDDHGHTIYSAINPDTKHINLQVSGSHRNGDRFDISGLVGRKGSTIKAHEFYHHLITHHNIHLHSDYEQSEGGMKVWKNLQKMPGIHMQSFNGSTEKYSELKPSFQRKYDMDSSTRLAAKKK